ncbi:MAG: CorA family divalent cation transporter [Acidimicrobiia bacterium]|nr:CorA family divalent cation transporter [Acidimicrobiia bacterium]
MLRSSPSTLLSDGARRRFSDVFDLTSRVVSELESARTALAATLDTYRGAEERRATEVTRVLTIYAAIMLPLTLLTGYFGMNFENLPLIEREWGWPAVTAVIVVIGVVSLGVFITMGWIRRPSARRAGTTLGRGLAEASRAPAQMAGALFEMSALPVKATAERLGGRRGNRRRTPPPEP